MVTYSVACFRLVISFREERNKSFLPHSASALQVAVLLA